VSSSLGIRSSVKGTCGSMLTIDLVRKSSGVIKGVVRVPNDLAADLKARIEAVKFDLKKTALRRSGVASSLGFSLSLSSGF